MFSSQKHTQNHKLGQKAKLEMENFGKKSENVDY